VRFVLDASVTLRWALSDGDVVDRNYADRVLESLADATAIVPALWYTEVIHVLRCYEEKGALGEAAVTEFVYRLRQLPIHLDAAAPAGTQLAVAAVSRQFKLSGYDAQYLELALRESVPIATLDRDVQKAAETAGVSLLAVE